MPPISNRHVSIGQVFLAQGVITRAQLDAALAVQRQDPGRRLASILVDQKAITEEQARLSLVSQDALDRSPLAEAISILEKAIGGPPVEAARNRHAEAQKLRDAVVMALQRMKGAGEK